jgi:hypothetical protein
VKRQKMLIIIRSLSPIAPPYIRASNVILILPITGTLGPEYNTVLPTLTNKVLTIIIIPTKGRENLRYPFHSFKFPEVINSKDVINIRLVKYKG